MKQASLTGIAAAAALLLSPVADLQAQETLVSSAGEYAAIVESVEGLYVRGLETRDFELIRTICIPDALLMGTNREGRLGVTTLDEWSVRFDPSNPPFRRLDFRVAKVDLSGTAAQVKIEFLVDGERPVTDYLHMLKLEGRWRIVNIIDNG